MCVETVGLVLKTLPIKTVLRVVDSCKIRPFLTIDMHRTDIRQLIAQTCEFPADFDTISEQLGDVEIVAPTGDSMTIAQILDIPGKVTYDSPDEVYTTIVGNLGDAFIGRKYYDDRGGARTDTDHSRDLHSF